MPKTVGRRNKIVFTAIVLFGFTSCTDFLEVELPKSKVASETVFSTDITATSAITAIYDEMLNISSFASGGTRSVTGLTGLSSGELSYISRELELMVEFEDTNLSDMNVYVHDLWTSLYKVIYQSNAVIEGVTESKSLSPQTRDELHGEALFLRAFSHFYLVNLFGAVPVVTSTDYQINSKVARAPVASVYDQIVNDLLQAQVLLPDEYVTKDRIRPNKATATALLARVYLYLQNWPEAEAQATAILDNTALYSLTTLDKVFLKNSPEAIWQLLPQSADGVNGLTNEGYYFAPSRISIYNVLSKTLMQSFETSDSRQNMWTGSLVSSQDTIYYPAKYQQVDQGPLQEYSMVFRLAEQYLIRAEARTHLGDLAGAIADVDVIRSRASLPKIGDMDPTIGEAELIEAIEKERFVELFSEWGHRWFDLKRLGRADAVLSQLKSDWSSTDQLYPIPQAELNKNSKLGDQNPGY